MWQYIKLFKTSYLRKAMLKAWVIAAGVTIIVIITTGNIYSTSQAKLLLESVQQASLYYGSAVVTAAATILALMLTILSLAHGKLEDPDKDVFVRLRAITTLCVVSFIQSIVLLLVVSFPVQKFENVDGEWFRYGYYAVTIWNGMLAANMIGTILILSGIAKGVIGSLSPDFDKEGKETSESEQERSDSE